MFKTRRGNHSARNEMVYRNNNFRQIVSKYFLRIAIVGVAIRRCRVNDKPIGTSMEFSNVAAVCRAYVFCTRRNLDVPVPLLFR